MQNCKHIIGIQKLLYVNYYLSVFSHGIRAMFLLNRSCYRHHTSRLPNIYETWPALNNPICQSSIRVGNHFPTSHINSYGHLPLAFINSDSHPLPLRINFDSLLQAPCINSGSLVPLFIDSAALYRHRVSIPAATFRFRVSLFSVHHCFYLIST